MKNIFFCILLLISSLGLANEWEPASSSRNMDSFEKILIYWDTSLSMANRDLDLEMELLSVYLESVGNAQVEFVPFDHRLGKPSFHRIENGDTGSLKSNISSLTHDGAALFKLLDLNKEAYAILIFSDGVGALDDLNLPEGKDVFMINSLPGSEFAGRRTYQRNYLDISVLGLGAVLERLGVVDVGNLSTQLPTKPESGTIEAEFRVEGVVFGDTQPLENVTIQVKGEDRGVVSGKDGRFNLEASVGDVLMIGYLGMKNQEYRITGDLFIEFYLDVEANQLNEVILKSKVDTPETKSTTTTAYGEKNPDQIGYAIQDVEEENFEGQANISDATRGKIISYNYSQNDDLSQIQLRQVQTLAAGTKNPLIVVDDVPLGVNNSATGGLTLSTYHIDPNNVDKITVLRGLAATNKYGTLARGGAILIYTKTRAGAKGAKKEYNSAMVQGNTYNETVTSVKTEPKGDYLKDFKKVKSVEDAYALYTSQRESYKDDFQYFVDVSQYMVKWGNADLSKKILLNILELNPNEAGYLRFVGMLLQDRKDFDLARSIYGHVLLLEPGESQSYRDLALILNECHQYQRSLDMYRKMKEGAYPSVSFEGLKKPLNSEMKRLILQHRNKLDTQGLPSHYRTPMNYDVRVVVDYNDREAEFDLQFVNPQKKFFVWSHRKFENKERIDQENNQGFNTEEFFLVDAEPGKWQVNIESPRQDSRRPLALRYTVFRNYGTQEETSQSKTLILNNIEGKYLLGIIKI